MRITTRLLLVVGIVAALAALVEHQRGGAWRGGEQAGLPAMSAS